MEQQYQRISLPQPVNTVHRVTMMGGVLGLFVTPKGAMDKFLEGLDRDEEVAFVLPDNWGLGGHLVSMIVLLCTALLYCPRPGYLVICKRAMK